MKGEQSMDPAQIAREKHTTEILGLDRYEEGGNRRPEKKKKLPRAMEQKQDCQGQEE